MQTLDVVNAQLATMGEHALASLDETHRFLPDCLRILDTTNRNVQARGWYFNRETLTLTPSPVDGGLYLSNDILNIRSVAPRDRYQERLSLRAGRVYDGNNATFVFTQNKEVTAIRLIPFEDLDETAASFISATAVARFQQDYDGDSTKTRSLSQDAETARIPLMAEELRQAGSNILHSNHRLQSLKTLTNGARSYYLGR